MRIGIYLTVLGIALATSRTPSTQTPEWRLTRPVSDVEKTRVLALAARLKIDRPGVIISGLINHPLACEALRIESVPATNGQRRTWRRVWVTSTEWPKGCSRLTPPDAARLDTWVEAIEARDVGAWRVENSDGVVDVETPPTIPYGEVAAIVEAVATGRLVDRMPRQTRVSLRPIPEVDAKSIFMIWNDALESSLYTVRFRGTNVVFLVVVRGTQVELRSWRREYA
jgi:hypothetical protein